MLIAREYRNYIDQLKQELVLALGCTEPIAVAYAAARARRLLGAFPDHIRIGCSGNIMKNVKSVIIPGTGTMRGIETAAALGAIAGDSALGMQVLQYITPEDVEQAQRFVEQGLCETYPIRDRETLQIVLEMRGEGRRTLVEIMHSHMGVVREEVDDVPVLKCDPGEGEAQRNNCDRITLAKIYEFVCTVPLDSIEGILRPQIENNLAIAQEGIRGHYGAEVGRTILQRCETDLRTRAVAYAAAGSDARMSGCMMPVVINSGSGNQGMAVSLPVIVVAQGMDSPDDKLLRALALSNLVAIYQKSFIGKLSAYCGVVSAACGSAAGIAYLYDSPFAVISDTIVNAIATISGIVCDGAKPSCAAKIATSVQAGFMAYDMARGGHVFLKGEGLVQKDVDGTIAAYGQMGRDGMRGTDEEILRIMSDAERGWE